MATVDADSTDIVCVIVHHKPTPHSIVALSFWAYHSLIIWLQLWFLNSDWTNKYAAYDRRSQTQLYPTLSPELHHVWRVCSLESQRGDFLQRQFYDSSAPETTTRTFSCCSVECSAMGVWGFFLPLLLQCCHCVLKCTCEMTKPSSIKYLHYSI